MATAKTHVLFRIPRNMTAVTAGLVIQCVCKIANISHHIRRINLGKNKCHQSPATQPKLGTSSISLRMINRKI